LEIHFWDVGAMANSKFLFQVFIILDQSTKIRYSEKSFEPTLKVHIIEFFLALLGVRWFSFEDFRVRCFASYLKRVFDLKFCCFSWNPISPFLLFPTKSWSTRIKWEKSTISRILSWILWASTYWFCLMRCCSILLRFNKSDESLGLEGIDASALLSNALISCSCLHMACCSSIWACSLNSAIFWSQVSLKSWNLSLCSCSSWTIYEKLGETLNQNWSILHRSA